MSTRPSQRRPIRAPHPTRPTTLSLPAAATPLAFAARSAATVAGLRIDADGHLVEVAVPLRATTWALAAFTDTGDGPAGLRSQALDADLVLWSGEPGDGTGNPVASVVAGMFGHPGPISGPMVLTGWASTPNDPAGRVDDIGVAAVILLAGTAASCDLGDRTAERAAELARLDVHIAAPPPPGHGLSQDDPDDDASEAGGEAYDALRHTVTRDGGWPACAECGEITMLGHPDHHPDALAVTTGTGV